jgi:hypothetical protein
MRIPSGWVISVVNHAQVAASRDEVQGTSRCRWCQDASVGLSQARPRDSVPHKPVIMTQILTSYLNSLSSKLRLVTFVMHLVLNLEN